jgi:hypothetical protein
MTTQAFGAPGRWIAVRGRPGGVPLGAILAGIAVGATALVGLLRLDHLPVTMCTFKALTGWACMTCGTTRALAHLFQLDVAGALAMNPLATLGVVGLVPWALADLALVPRGRALDVELAPPLGHVVRVAVVAAILANWVYLLAVGR